MAQRNAGNRSDRFFPIGQQIDELRDGFRGIRSDGVDVLLGTRTDTGIGIIQRVHQRWQCCADVHFRSIVIVLVPGRPRQLAQSQLRIEPQITIRACQRLRQSEYACVAERKQLAVDSLPFELRR